jgi:hypothetical protein
LAGKRQAFDLEINEMRLMGGGVFVGDYEERLRLLFTLL